LVELLLGGGIEDAPSSKVPIPEATLPSTAIPLESDGTSPTTAE
jgi:hypothetical protein